MRRIRVIGIGVGDPEYVTVQAVNAMNATEVFFVVDKGDDKHDLADLRREILDRYVAREYKLVDIADPRRDRSSSRYREAVEVWRRQRADAYERAITDALAEDETGAFLVWGDPSLYDSTLAILADIAARGTVLFSVDVVPGISSAQALAARHAISLNRVGEPVHITTGRRLASGFPECSGDVVVMLDADCTFKDIAHPDTLIYWGAYLGSSDEIVVSGRVGEVSERIDELRRTAREEKGWIMDTYLLRVPTPDATP